MAHLFDNPRRRRRRSSKRRRASSKRRRSASRTRRNPTNPTPKRRRRGRKRKSSSRRSGYRHNPIGVPSGGSLVKQAMGVVPAIASVWAGDAATAVVKTRIPFLRNVSWPLVGIGVALVGGALLKKFGGPLRKHAATFTQSNLIWAAYNAIPYQFGGYGTAQKLKLAPMVGASGAPLNDYAMAGIDPGYMQLGAAPQLYDYVTANEYGN